MENGGVISKICLETEVFGKGPAKQIIVYKVAIGRKNYLFACSHKVVKYGGNRITCLKWSMFI